MKQKEKDKTDKHSIWWWILVIIVIIFLYNLLFNNAEEYTYCVDNCVYDNQACAYGGNSAKECFYDMDSCLSDCETNYG